MDHFELAATLWMALTSRWALGFLESGLLKLQCFELSAFFFDPIVFPADHRCQEVVIAFELSVVVILIVSIAK